MLNVMLNAMTFKHFHTRPSTHELRAFLHILSASLCSQQRWRTLGNLKRRACSLANASLSLAHTRQEVLIRGCSPFVPSPLLGISDAALFERRQWRRAPCSLDASGASQLGRKEKSSAPHPAVWAELHWTGAGCAQAVRRATVRTQHVVLTACGSCFLQFTSQSTLV